MTPRDDDSPSESSESRRLVLVTGLSGSGKSVAAGAFEDLGFYVVDNLPVSLLRQLLTDPGVHLPDGRPVAVVADVRSPGFADAVPALLEAIDRDQLDPLVVYLDAAESVLVRRYSETRRSHPMGEGERPVLDGIRREKGLLASWRAAADLILDTSDWSVHDMRRAIIRQFDREESSGGPMVVSIVSFGFKHGPPAGADLMFDVRFLANPYFIPGLREQTGRDAPVIEFLGQQDDYLELLDRLSDLLGFLLPRYVHENRRYLTVAIGCTGGRHRSVATAEHLASHLRELGWYSRLSHRDVERR
ncbi:MAG: RNase adapter RapZ [Acidobacteriota bacterium]